MATPGSNICATEPSPIKFRLTVENKHNGTGTATATLIGIQKGVEVYNKAITLEFLSSGKKSLKKSNFTFPPYTPTAKGRITWKVTLDDDDPDKDVATATTRVICEESKGDD